MYNPDLYALALYEVVNSGNRTEVYFELLELNKILKDNNEFKILAEKGHDSFIESVSKLYSKEVVNVVSVLAYEGELHLLGNVIDCYKRLLFKNDDAHFIKVTTNSILSDSLKDKIESVFNKKYNVVFFDYEINETMSKGIKVLEDERISTLTIDSLMDNLLEKIK